MNLNNITVPEAVISAGFALLTALMTWLAARLNPALPPNPPQEPSPQNPTPSSPEQGRRAAQTPADNDMGG
ncbi:hypothetical protein ACIQ9Q_42890 [Streptomyces sp. NPDC094438]|uniref:hypothetical protein n=1 Tax=Streptomyces sp. NPDC094438 TaxID=3366061 RepID=UPI0037F8BB30